MPYNDNQKIVCWLTFGFGSIENKILCIREFRTIFNKSLKASKYMCEALHFSGEHTIICTLADIGRYWTMVREHSLFDEKRNSFLILHVDKVLEPKVSIDITALV